MTDLEPFKPPFPANGYQLRVELRDGDPWFLAAEVCGMLDIQDPRQAVTRLDESDRCQARTRWSGQARIMWWINESGLYELIMRSDKPEARIFRRWVTSEVLPSIRKTGGYGQRALSRMELLELAMEAEKEAMAARGELENARPAIEAHAQFMRANNTVAMGTAAKVLGIGPNRLFAMLREHRILISTAGARHNTPYQEYVERGWFEVKAGSFEHNSGEVEATYTTRVTPKGLEGIRKLLAS
jgi:prophage antirepressor-like protein